MDNPSDILFDIIKESAQRTVSRRMGPPTARARSAVRDVWAFPGVTQQEIRTALQELRDEADRLIYQIDHPQEEPR